MEFQLGSVQRSGFALLLAGAASSSTAADAGLFIAVGHNGLRVTSRDGLKWENAQVGKEGETYRAIAFGNRRWVAIGSYGGSNIFAVTQDGTTWKTSIRDAKYSKYLLGLKYGDNTFVGVGGDPGSVGSSEPFIMRTQDGEAWGDMERISGKNVLRRLAWGGGRFVGVGDRGRRATSTDMKEWADAPAVRAIDTLVDVAFGNGLFVGVGLNGLRMFSRDGLTWENRQTGEEGEHLNTVVWIGSRFVAIGAGATYSSPDGQSWERHPNHDAPLAVAYGGGVFVGSSWKGRLWRSTDAISWQQVYKADQHLEAIAFGAV